MREPPMPDAVIAAAVSLVALVLWCGLLLLFVD